MLEFRLLGSLEVVRDGSPLPLGGPRQRALLALLLLRANEPVSRERVIDEFWGEEPPATAAEGLKVYIFRLRKLLDDPSGRILVTVPNGYTLRLEPKQLDLFHFQRLTYDARHALDEGRPEEAASTFRSALELWRGPPLADLPTGAVSRAPVDALEELRVAAITDRIDADLALGRASSLVSELELLLIEYPYRERLYGQLMTALYSEGRQAEALAVYRRARTVLRELGLEPGPGLRRLERSILRHDLEQSPQSTAEGDLQRLADLKLFWRRDHLLEGERVLEDALARARDAAPAVRAEALETAAWVAQGRGEFVRARDQAEAALALYEEIGDLRGATRCRLHLATVAFHLATVATYAPLDVSDAQLEKAAAAVRSLDEQQLHAWMSFVRGLNAVQHQQFASARDHFFDAMQLYESTDFPRGIGLCLVNLGEAAFLEGDLAAAGSFGKKALARFYADGDHSGTVAAVLLLAGCAGREGRHLEATMLLGASEAFGEATGAAIHNRHLFPELVPDAESRLGALAFRRARKKGHRMTIDDVVAVALRGRLAEAV